MSKVLCLLLFCLNTGHTALTQQRINNRILVVSGGGARGAWGAGFAKRLSIDSGLYRIAFGTSTGSLMIPLLVLGKFDELQKGYTSVTQCKIFDVNPFRKDGELKLLTAAGRIVRKRKTLGESNNLRRLIDTFLTDADYKEIRKDKVLGIAVVDFKTGEKDIKYSTDLESAKEMKDWIWASSNQPLFMTYYQGTKKNRDGTTVKGDHSYVDGGVRETVPLTDALFYAIKHQIKDIDVIINQPKYPILDTRFQPKNILQGLLRLIDIWKTEVVDNDVLLATQASEVERQNGDTININLHYFPYQLFKDNQKDLLFDPVKMTELWNKGFEGVEDPLLLKTRPNRVLVSIPKFLKYQHEIMEYKKLFNAAIQE